MPFIHLGKSWPLLLALFFLCWWPALVFWASHQSPRLWATGEAEFWWDAWYAKLALLMGGVAGYALNLWREE